jgi:hypothetical protein
MAMIIAVRGRVPGTLPPVSLMAWDFAPPGVRVRDDVGGCLVTKIIAR